MRFLRFFNCVFFSRTGRAGRSGFAYTFIAPEQVKYAGDIIYALEMSGQLIPEDIKKAWDDYVKEMEAVVYFFII